MSRLPVRARGVRRRLTVAFVLVAAVSAGALAIGSYLLVRQARLNDSLSRAAVEARVDLGLAAGIRGSQSTRYLSGFIRQYERRQVHVVLAIAGRAAIVSDPAISPAIPARLRRAVSAGQLGYQRIRVGTAPYLVLGAKVPASAARMYFFFAENQIQADLAQLMHVLLAGWAAVIIAASAVGRILAARTLEPVARASAAARAMADGDLSTRLPASAADEFGTWAASFNLMADSLEAKINALSAAQARERRFTSDVAHELRTPLTALVAEASLLREQAAGLPDGARRPAELLIRDVTRLRTLVDELMEISRLDAGQESVRSTELNVRSVIDGLLTARGWRAKVTLEGDAPVVAADPRRLERIVANLVDNALQHGGGTARVLVGQQDGRTVITVADAGPGIAAEHIPHVFERFYKADPSRSGAGSGLGLAIALENARLLGGELTLRSDPSAGTLFRLTWPASGPDSVSER